MASSPFGFGGSDLWDAWRQGWKVGRGMREAVGALDLKRLTV